MFFEELNNDEWALLAPLVSDEPAIRLNRRGRPRAEPRIVTNAVLWILTTGEPWSRLPGRYPSGPTCRRRFEEWQLNGILLEMVRLLSQSGRSFAYIPQPAPPVAAKPAAPVAQTRTSREDTLRGVSWKSPESWQAPRVSSAPGQWRVADPIGDITRQLSGLPNEAAPLRAATPAAAGAASGAARAVWAVQPLATQQRQAGRAVDPLGGTPAPQAVAQPVAQPAAHALSVTQAALSAIDATLAAHGYRISEAADQHASLHGAPGTSSACSVDERREPLTLSLAPRGMQFEDPRGYLIYVVVEQVPNAMYRASVEITKDGARVERSGLVGPRFEVIADAQRFAFDWARQWIDRECATAAAAVALAARQAQANVATATHAMSGYAARSAAHPLSALRHAPEPTSSGSAVSGAAPSDGSLSIPPEGAPGPSLNTPSGTSSSALRGPLRRYPGEAASAAVTGSTGNMSNTSGPAATAGATGAASGANETTTTERFSSSYRELVSHAAHME
ncbi:transposase [Paraburkholderia sp. MMS20-SJTR3]|uniref:Transposase n=1 Tax=Paraburkholderia sejongensis TaxID=2886946 RepID=A0ABS8JNH6_9BURK|nr:transposase [Paraburkholderia sp. MMS20-SJTR3]MCC8391430.1 transposase [Paraburkholderia sp. MMS20-SJTR3]